MPVVMDHQVIPVRNKEESADLLARILGVERAESRGRYAPVQLNDGSFLDFETREEIQRLHFGFRVTEGEFDEIIARLQAEKVPYGTSGSKYNGEIVTSRPGRGVYFPDPSGHSFEVITQPYAIQP